jgi:ABC-type multidrug transport system fused ATPase/permease subunit
MGVNLSEGQKQRIWIARAFRFSTIRDLDRILLMNENRLVAIGTHRSLLESNDYYRSLVSYQQIRTDLE